MTSARACAGHPAVEGEDDGWGSSSCSTGSRTPASSLAVGAGAVGSARRASVLTIGVVAAVVLHPGAGVEIELECRAAGVREVVARVQHELEATNRTRERGVRER